MGEGVGGGVGVGRRVILVFFGFFSFFDFFGGRVCGWAGFLLVCVKKEAAPLVWVLVGGDGVRQGCLVSVVCCEHGRDACVGCGGRRGQEEHGAWSIREPQRWGREEKGPVVCVPAPGGTGEGWGRCACCTACMVYLTRGNSVAGCRQARGWVRGGVLCVVRSGETSVFCVVRCMDGAGCD